MIGQVLVSRYEVLQETDSGPVWTAYKARDRASGKFMSVRVMLPEVAREPGVMEEVEENIGRLARVSHPALERVLALERTQSGAFLVCEFTSGSPLEDRIRRLSSYSVPVAVGTIIEAADAVKALHDAQIVHGDLSGRSIFATATEGVKVTMPGFWSAYGHSARAAVGVLRSMAPYLAPEITSGGMPSVSSDIYALGVVLWQLLTGRLPFAGDTPAAIAAKHLSIPYPSLRSATASVPMPLDEIVKKCMAKQPADRYERVDHLLSDLRNLLDALRFGRPLTWPLNTGASPRSRVAPELNALDGKPVAKTPKPKSPDPAPSKRMPEREVVDGLPGWVTALGYVAVLAIVGTVAAFAYYSVNKPPNVTVPNVVGKPIAEARKEMETQQLVLRLAKTEPSDRYSAGVVTELRPSAGAPARANAIIDATVSSGSKQVIVPVLRGKSVTDARNLLERMNLEMSTEFEYVPDRELDRDFVAGQSPVAGKKVNRFSKVKLLIANGDREGSSYLGSWQMYRIKIPVPDEGQPVEVKIEKTDSRGTDEVVYQQTHEPGDTVSERFKGYGESVTFVVYLDGAPVKRVTLSPEAMPGDQPKTAEDE